MTTRQHALSRETGCDIRSDRLTRHLFATDASIYQIEPSAVAFPRSPEETSRVVQAASADGMAITPRGAGTGLAGGALGDGLIVDYARHNRRIASFDADRRTVHVEAGVVLDQLNEYLRLHGLRFGPDVATGSRATLGGMIANNSSGSHVPLYGTTTDHVESLDLVLADGERVTVGAASDALSECRREIAELIEAHREQIDARMPAGLLKRRPGYAIDDWLREGPDLSRVLAGSEGTLAIITGATLRLCPLPAAKGLGAICFATVDEAMQATVELLDLDPAAIEHIDDVLFDQTRGQLAFQRARALLELDTKPCRAILLVEFFDVIDGPLATLEAKRLGLRTRTFRDEAEMDAIWNLRKAGLSLLTGCAGAAKPIAGIEDACVRPEVLPDYVARLRRLMEPHGLTSSFYGHAASGLLHVRPVIDLHSEDDLRIYRHLADDVSALVKEFKGSIAGEHGVGIARTPYIEEHLGPELMGVLRRIKHLFDPHNLFNPGKILPTGRYAIDADLRWGADYKIALPFEPTLAFASKDRSFVGNLEQCNGCGGCRKDAPTMCPTYIVTHDEIMSTRGRANAIRAHFDGRMDDAGLQSTDLEQILGSCLSCKACTTECPSNVNLALLKAELLHARQQEHGVTLRDRLLSRVDLVAAVGGLFPRLSNGLLATAPLRSLMESTLGLASQRRLPAFAAERFDHWFAGHRPEGDGARGRVILWDDTFVRHYEPDIARAAVRVLERSGFEVLLPKDRACCGRPAFSLGRLDLARQWAEHNLRLLNALDAAAPIVFLEPSCFSMIFDDYRELGIEGADALRDHVYLFEQFIDAVLDEDADALRFEPCPYDIAIHAHCHAKALTDTSVAARLARRIPEARTHVLDTACCGMAGAYGASVSTYDLSMQLGRLLAEKIDPFPQDARIVASGTSCRQQIAQVTGRRPLHMAEVLAEAMQRG